MSAQAIATPVLADYVPGQRVRAAALVGIGAVVLAVCAQVAVPLPFTPVPVSLATFAVILLGASMGPALGAGSVLVYLIAGLAGAPVFAEQASGWAFASFGYVLGYLLAVLIAGRLARRGADRTPWRAGGMALLGTLGIYAAGVPWLMGFLGVDLATGLSLGLIPFVLGDVLKVALAMVLLPSAWKVVERVRRPK